MTISVPDTRQWALVANASFAFGDFTSGTGAAVFALDQDAVVTAGQLLIDTAWDSGTSDGLEVGDSADDNRYLASIDAQGTGRDALVPTGFQVTNATRDVLVEVTSVGTAATAGAGRIQVEYIVEGRATENFE